MAMMAMRLLVLLFVVVTSGASTMLRHNTQQTLDSSDSQLGKKVPKLLDMTGIVDFLGIKNGELNDHSFEGCRGPDRAALLAKIAKTNTKAGVRELCHVSWRRGHHDGDGDGKELVKDLKTKDKAFAESYDDICPKRKDNDIMKCVLGFSDDIDAVCPTDKTCCTNIEKDCERKLTPMDCKKKCTWKDWKDSKGGASKAKAACLPEGTKPEDPKSGSYNRLRLNKYYFSQEGAGFTLVKNSGGKENGLPGGWSMCENLAWLFCGATGNLPYQRPNQEKEQETKPLGVGLFRMVTAPKTLTWLRPYATNDQCLNVPATTSADLLIAREDFVFQEGTRTHECKKNQQFNPAGKDFNLYDKTASYHDKLQSCKAAITVHEISFLAIFCSNGKDLFTEDKSFNFDCKPNFTGPNLAKHLAQKGKPSWEGYDTRTWIDCKGSAPPKPGKVGSQTVDQDASGAVLNAQKTKLQRKGTA